MPPQPAHAMVAWVAALALAGCTAPAPAQEPTVASAEVFVLSFHIVDLGRQEKTANPGHHCGDVQKQEDTLTVWLWPGEERPTGPWLAVFPEMPPDWHPTIGGAPYKTTFPAEPDPEVHGDDTTLGALSWQGSGAQGKLRIDGEAVPVPHSWSVLGEDRSWRADATVAAWQGDVVVDRYDGLCD